MVVNVMFGDQCGYDDDSCFLNSTVRNSVVLRDHAAKHFLSP